MGSKLGSVFVCMALALLAAGVPARAATTDDSRICGQETARQEQALRIPDRLLHAISLVESGRWDPDRQASFAWPWTVTAEGEGRFLPTKAAAISEVKKLQSRGVTNIDVGCMQVNLQAHPDAFRNLDEAFDPATNVAYGAQFLTELYAATRNWAQASAYYHSQTPPLAAAYKSRLLAAWDAARRRPDDRLLDTLAEIENRPAAGMILPGSLAGADPNVVAALPASDAAQIGAAHLAKTLAERAEAKRAADAFRQAALEKYRQHKLQMADNRG